MHATFKIALNWTGCILAIVGVAFVALRLRDFGAEIDFSRFGLIECSAMAALITTYALANYLLSLSWWNLLRHFGASPSLRWAVKAYGISQIAKYVPGNIFHLAGRQATGMAAGVPAWPLAKSALWELGLISATGGVFGLLALPLLMPNLPRVASIAIFASTMGIVAIILWRLIGPYVVRAFKWYAVFLTISGLLFVGLIEMVVEKPGNSVLLFPPLIGAYVLAWLAGLVTPGAPAGLGIRELVLIFLLNGVVGEADLLLAVVLGRIITVGGDVAYFAAASLMNFRVRIFKEN